MSRQKTTSIQIAQNRRARHDYFIEDKFEAGIALQGWEVKSARANKVQLTDTYVIFQNSEAWLIGAHFSALKSASTHFVTEPGRIRKLLMHRKELNRLISASDQKGYTIICTAMYWKNHLIKVEIALAKGKQNQDKRETEKQRDWQRQKQRIMRN